MDNLDVLLSSLLGPESGQDEVDDCLESDHDEEDEVDEKRRKVSKVSFLWHIYIFLQFEYIFHLAIEYHYFISIHSIQR